jgi:hypothetical protein
LKVKTTLLFVFLVAFAMLVSAEKRPAPALPTTSSFALVDSSLQLGPAGSRSSSLSISILPRFISSSLFTVYTGAAREQNSLILQGCAFLMLAFWLKKARPGA